MVAESTVVLPIGHAVGARHEDVPDDVAKVHQVRVGADMLEPTENEYALWELVHGVPDGQGTPPPWSRETLRADAVRRGVGTEPEVDALLASLREQGLLVEVAPDGTVAFAREYRMVPLALGLGSPAGDLFGIGLLYQPLVMVTPALADLWQFSPMAPDLWTACEESAAVADAAGVGDPEQIEPSRVLDGVLGSLMILLCSRVACLDVRTNIPEAVR